MPQSIIRFLFEDVRFEFYELYPPESKVSKEEANLTERKNPHTPVYGVKEFVCLSVCYIIFGQNSMCAT